MAPPLTNKPRPAPTRRVLRARRLTQTERVDADRSRREAWTGAPPRSRVGARVGAWVGMALAVAMVAAAVVAMFLAGAFWLQHYPLGGLLFR
jgi:cytochrome c-type biogenesis protein CcmH/NrfG